MELLFCVNCPAVSRGNIQEQAKSVSYTPEDWRVKPSGHAAQSETHQTYVNIQQEHTEVVEAPWGQPLREVGGKQEAGEEGKEEVVTVTGQGVTVAAAAPAAQKDLETEKNNRQVLFKQSQRHQRPKIYFIRVLQK